MNVSYRMIIVLYILLDLYSISKKSAYALCAVIDLLSISTFLAKGIDQQYFKLIMNSTEIL